MAATQDEVDRVKRYLPEDASENGWDDAEIAERWTGGVASTVRAYWFKRVSDTAGYIDLSDAGGSLPITQIYRQAREMLAYWDEFLGKYGDIDPDLATGQRKTRIGKIKSRYPHPPITSGLGLGRPGSPYKRV